MTYWMQTADDTCRGCEHAIYENPWDEGTPQPNFIFSEEMVTVTPCARCRRNPEAEMLDNYKKMKAKFHRPHSGAAHAMTTIEEHNLLMAAIKWRNRRKDLEYGEIGLIEMQMAEKELEEAVLRVTDPEPKEEGEKG